MAKLNSPMHKKVTQLMEAQGRNADFKTRKAVFNLHNLHRRLGDYVGTEAQNFALHNVMSHERKDQDVMLLQSHGGKKYSFDVPGHSVYSTVASTPVSAETSAIQKANTVSPNMASYFSFQGTNIPMALQQQGFTAQNGGLFDIKTNQMVPGVTYTPGETGAFGDTTSPELAAYMSARTQQQLAERGFAEGTVPVPKASDFGPTVPGGQNPLAPQGSQPPPTPAPPQAPKYDALGNQITPGQTGVNPQGINMPPALNTTVNQAAGLAPTQRTASQILSLFQQTPLRKSLNVSGAVRIAGTDQVFTIGPGGKPITDPQQLLSQGFREDEVQQITREEAQALGIDVSKIPQTPPSNAPPSATGTTPEGFLASGAQTPEGILATEEARQAKEAEKTRAAKEKQDFQERSATAGLAFSGIRTKGEQDIAAASYAKQEGISLNLAQVILKAAVAEQKRLVGEVREVGNKLVRVSPDGKVTTLYEDTSQLTDQQKMDIQQQYLGRELELRRQSELEMERILAAAQLGRYEPTKGSGAGSDLTRTQQATQAGDAIKMQARQQLEANKGAVDGFYDPGIYMNFRNQLATTNPGDLDNFDKELAGKLNPVDRARLGIPAPKAISNDNPFAPQQPEA